MVFWPLFVIGWAVFVVLLETHFEHNERKRKRGQ